MYIYINICVSHVYIYVYIYIYIYIYVRPSLWNATKHIASERGQTRRFGKWLCSKVMLQTVFQSDPPVTVYIYYV